jgi:hypothetical protein
VSDPSAGPGAEEIVRDYFSRLERALAPLPKDRRLQILEDLRDHVTTALAEGAPARQVLDALGTPEDIASEAFASGPVPPPRRRWRFRRPQLRYTLALGAVVIALAGGTFGFEVTSDTAAPAAHQHRVTTASQLTAHVADAESACSPATVAPASGGPASALTATATEVASGTTGGHAWTLWSKKGQKGAQGIENGGLVIGGRAYGLCPGYPNPAEFELADTGSHGLVFGVIGYPGLAKVWLYRSTAGTFDTGAALPAPDVRVVDGVSFFIGALPQSACDYPSVELNATSPGVSDEHNLGFGACTAGKLVPITASQGIWQLPPGHFVSDFPSGPGSGRGVGIANAPMANSTCAPATDAASSGGPASALTATATEVASGTTGGHAWTLWSKKGEKGAQGIENGGLVIGGRAYGLCPGYPNPAEFELADTGSHGLVFGVIGYPGLAKVWLYRSTAGTFERGAQLPSPDVRVVDGVSFFIGTLPQAACDYPSVELNATSPGVSDEHNLGFGACTAGKLVPITASQGIWQLPPGQFISNFPDSPGPGPGAGAGIANVPMANSTCAPATDAASSGGPASALTATATEVASGTTGGHAWTLWSKKGEKGAQGIENGGLVIGGRAYGLCPGYPNPAEFELADTGSHGLVFGVIGYHGLAKVWLYRSTAGTFDTGAALPAPDVRVVDGVSFFISALPQSACDYPALELNATSPGVSDEHNLGFGACSAGKLVPITASQGIWQLPPGHFTKNFR